MTQTVQQASSRHVVTCLCHAGSEQHVAVAMVAQADSQAAASHHAVQSSDSITPACTSAGVVTRAVTVTSLAAPMPQQLQITAAASAKQPSAVTSAPSALADITRQLAGIAAGLPCLCLHIWPDSDPALCSAKQRPYTCSMTCRP